MTCNTVEQMNSAIEFHNAINETKPDQSAETSVLFLDRTQELAEKSDGKYKAKGQPAVISESVTEKVAKEFKYFTDNPLLEQQGLIGNYVHSLNETVLTAMLDRIKDSGTDHAHNVISSWTIAPEGLKKIHEDYGKTLDPKSVEMLVDGNKKVLLSILNQQRTINRLTKTDGKVTIRLEQILLDPRRDIGGTADIVAIFSDNTAAIVDFKSKIIPQSNLDANGNIIDGSEVIKPKDKDKYSLQTGEYGRILRESYGVRSIRSVTIVPIKLVVALNTITNKYSSKITGLRFPGQDKLLEKVLPFSNKTGFKELDEFILSIDKRIEALEKRLSQNRKLSDEILPKIEKLNQARLDILTKHELNTILDYAKSLASTVSKAEAGELSIAELRDLIHELQLLTNLAKSTRGYRAYLREHGSILHGKTVEGYLDDVEAKMAEISGELDDKIEELKEVLYEDKITKLIEIHTGFKITDDYGNFIPLAQEGYVGKMFYQLSQYDTPQFQALRQILNQVNYETRQKTDAVVEEIVKTENAVYNWLKSTGRSFEDLVSIMVDPETDNFWRKYSKDFSELLDSLDANELPRYFKPRESYEEWYEQALARETDRLKSEVSSDEELKDKIEIWKNRNDLSLDNGKPAYPNAWYLAKKYNKLDLIEQPNHFNDKFKFIQSVPELKAYYAMFEKYNKQFRDLLGVEYTKLPNHFLPNIRKSMSERLSEQGFQGFLEGTQDFFKDFSIREEDRSEDSTYNSNDKIPIYFLNKFRNKDGGLQMGEKSYQFGRSLAIFAKMAYHNEAITKREAEILAMHDFLVDEAEQISKSRGKNLIDKMGNTLTEKLQASDLPEIYKAFVDMYVYGINVKAVIGDKSGAIEKKLLKAKEYFTLKALGFNITAGLGSFTSAKINAIIEGNKGIIYSRQQYLESLKQSWNEREKFLAINAFFDPMGHRLNNPRIAGENTYGERHYGDPTMRGWVKKYVNSRMLMNIFSVGDQYIEEIVLVSMAKNFYIDDLGNLRRIKSDQDLEKYKDRTVWSLFSYDKEKGASFKIPEGKEARIFEDFRAAVQAGQSRIKGTIPEEDKAYWQNNIIGQLVMHFKSWMPGILFERFGKVKFDNRIDSIYMGKYIALREEFSNPDKLAFSTFMQKILLPKLGKLVVDISTFGLMSKHRLNDKLNKEYTFNKWLEEYPQYKGKVTFEEFNEVQQKQLRSVIQELRTLLVFAGLMVLMGIDWDDDGEKDYKKYFLTRKIASLIFKTQQELAFTYSPVAFTQMVKSPLPMTGLVTDAYNTLKNTLDEGGDILFGEQRLIGGQTVDKTPILSQSIKWAPGFGGITRFLDIFNDDVTYENTQQ